MAVPVDTEIVFQLIDRILPFEACLYHQVLPLAIDGNRLRLGMVMLDDAAALTYVRRLVGYMNYLIAPRSISSETHHATLTAYLKHTETRPKQTPFNSKKSDLSEKATLLIDSPGELTPQALYNTLQKSQDALPVLSISTCYANRSNETLTTLPPDQLIQELLGRILTDGIGRLFFERQSNHGRILWSQNGVLQSAMEGLSLSLFQALLDELKFLTHLPIKPVQQVQQVEIERLCEKERVLLRLRIVPTAHGEEATLQVLRGAALKFYQRQQLTQLSRDALGIARKLQQKVEELHALSESQLQTGTHQAAQNPAPVRAKRNSEGTAKRASSEIDGSIDQVLQIVERQLQDLKRIQPSPRRARRPPQPDQYS